MWKMKLLTAVATCTGDPFDTDAIANLQARAFGACAKLDDLSYTLMATNLARLGGKRKHAPLSYIRAGQIVSGEEDLQCWS